jgi:hypothetical protein
VGKQNQNFGTSVELDVNRALVSFSDAPPQLVLRVRRCRPALCDDGNACTQDRCDASAQCVYSPAANGTACDDHNACTQRRVPFARDL